MNRHQTYHQRKANRLCVDCGAGLLEEWNGVRCPECRRIAVARQVRWREANPNKSRAVNRRAEARRIEAARMAYVCRYCGDPAKIKADGTPSQRCKGCTEYHAEQEAARKAAVA